MDHLAQCLRARVDYEVALIGADEAGQIFAELDAQLTGGDYYAQGRLIDDVPALFQSVSELADAWRTGWLWAEEKAARAACPGCWEEDESGRVCPYHG